MERKRPLASEDLIEEDLDVVGGERLGRHDHFVEVALHQFCYHVAVGRFAVKEKTLTHSNDLRLHRHKTTLNTGLSVGCLTTNVNIVFGGKKQASCQQPTLNIDQWPASHL